MSEKKLSRYLGRRNRLVKGWLEPAAIRSVCALSGAQRQAQFEGGIAEIGVHHGRFFILLYLLGEGNEPAVAIDLFSHQELNPEHSGAGDLELFKQNLSKHADAKRLIVHEGDSTQLTSADLLSLAGGPLRLISIDGGHTPEITAHDLETAEGALSEGGIIVLDDCFNELWPGVCEGVFRHFSKQRSIVPFGIGGNKTFFCHPAYSLRYTSALRGMQAQTAERDFLGHRVTYFDFTPTPLAIRIGRNDFWLRMKHLPPARLARWLYHQTQSMRTN
jgi:hypothetical protein